MLGLAWAMARKSRSELDQRLNLVSSAPQGAERETPSGEPAKSKPKPRVFELERLLLLDSDHPWKLNNDSWKLILGAIVSAVAVWGGLHNLLHIPVAFCAPATFLGAYLGLRMMVIRERKRIEAAFAALFPDAVDAVARMLRAGLPVTSAFEMVCKEAPAPVDTVFATLAGQLKIGMTLEDTLRLSSKRIRIADFQFFAVAIILQQSAGGNLLPTLEALTQMMRGRRAMQAKARAATAEVRLSAYVLGGLPFLTVGALFVLSPDYLTPLFQDPRGHGVLAAGVGGLLLSSFVMRQMMRSVEDA